LKALKKEVDARLKQVEENTKKNAEEEVKKHALGQKRLGKLKFEDQELELKLSEEITGNLRTLKVHFFQAGFLFRQHLFILLFNCLA
jgi:hypothetical protein